MDVQLALGTGAGAFDRIAGKLSYPKADLTPRPGRFHAFVLDKDRRQPRRWLGLCSLQLRSQWTVIQDRDGSAR